MARQVGLGKSLAEVLESLTPAEGLPEPARLDRQALVDELDQLTADIHELRERMGLVSSLAGKKSARRDLVDASAAGTKKGKKKGTKKGRKGTKNERNPAGTRKR